MTEPTDAEIFVVAREAGLLPDNSHPAPETRAARKHSNAVQAFARAVLAEFGTPPAVAGEPVGVVRYTDTRAVVDWYGLTPPSGAMLYTTPQPTQAQAGAVPLTDEQIEKLRIGQEYWQWGLSTNVFRHAARSIEAAHGIGIKGGQHGADK